MAVSDNKVREVRRLRREDVVPDKIAVVTKLPRDTVIAIIRHEWPYSKQMWKFPRG